MTTKVEQKERTHESILESAARLVREKGIGGASVADVMKGAGLTVGGFYAHFRSKEALVDAVLRTTAERLRESLFFEVDDKPEEARIELVLKRYLSAKHRDEYEKGCPFPSVMSEVGTTAECYRGVVAEEISNMAAGLEEHLPTGGALPRKQAALALVALMVGGLGMARALRGTRLSDDVLAACRVVGARAFRG